MGFDHEIRLDCPRVQVPRKMLQITKESISKQLRLYSTSLAIFTREQILLSSAIVLGNPHLLSAPRLHTDTHRHTNTPHTLRGHNDNAYPGNCQRSSVKPYQNNPRLPLVLVFQKKKKINVYPFWEEVTDYTKVKVNSQMFIRSARY